MSTKYFKKIVAFNATGSTTVYENSEPLPAGVTPLFMLLDASGSIKHHEKELRRVGAAFIEGSNAWDTVMANLAAIPRPQGKTNIIETFMAFASEMAGCDIILVTDGLENCFFGKLTMPNQDGESMLVDFGELNKMDDKTGYHQATANFLCSVCGAQLYYLGLGAEAESMAAVFVKRRNVHVGHLDSASDAEIVSTVRALVNRGTQQALLPPEQRVVQEAPIVTISQEVRAIIDALDTRDLDSVVRGSNALAITGVYEPPPIITAADIKQLTEEIEPSVLAEVTVPCLKTARSAMLLGMMAMAEAPTPAALITGARCGVLDLGNKSLGSFVNKVYDRLKNKGILVRKQDTPEEGMTIQFETKSVKIPKQSRVYKTDVSVDVFKELAQDADWAIPLQELKRKGGTKRKAEEAEGSASGSQSGSPQRVCA